MGIVHPGSRNPNWKGGRTIASNGYVLIKRRDHPAADSRGYVYEHRLVAEEKLGRPFATGEIVHHINEIKTDNRPENIEVVVGKAGHGARHRTMASRRRLPDESNPIAVCACGCGTEFARFDGSGRPRIFVTGHNASHDTIGRWEARG